MLPCRYAAAASVAAAATRRRLPPACPPQPIAAMAAIVMRDPRPGTGHKKTELLKPGSTVTVVGLVPEVGARACRRACPAACCRRCSARPSLAPAPASPHLPPLGAAAQAGASMAVLRWTNPDGKTKTLNPATMELVALQVRPCGRLAAAPTGRPARRQQAIRGRPTASPPPANPYLLPACWPTSLPFSQELPSKDGGPGRQLDVPASRAAIRAVLPPGGPTPSAPVYIFSRDSSAVGALGAPQWQLLPACWPPVVHSWSPSMCRPPCRPLLQGAGAVLGDSGGAEAITDALERSAAAMREALQGVPATHVGTVPSSALSRRGAVACAVACGCRRSATPPCARPACSLRAPPYCSTLHPPCEGL